MNTRFAMVLVLVAALSMTLASVGFAQGGNDKEKFRADLKPLNGSGASGHAKLTLKGNKLNAKINSHGLAPELPHAQHIHGMAQAISECPTLAADQEPRDGLVNTAEGLPSYGPIAVSFTTRGDTSPASGLAVSRFPVANDGGSVNYKRTFAIPSKVANNLGKFAVVQHGVDLNGNGEYDFEAAGASELDPSLPQEATIPANCGVIDPVGKQDGGTKGKNDGAHHKKGNKDGGGIEAGKGGAKVGGVEAGNGHAHVGGLKANASH